jgi:hypothetical protein
MEKVTPPGTPAKRALAVLDTPAPATPLPPRRISKKVRAAIDAMVSGKCKRICDAAEHVGLARESLSRALSQPHVAQHLREKVLRHLAIAAARAGYVKGELLDSDNAIARDRASSFILGLAGIRPESEPTVNINIEAKAGFVIDLTEPGQGPAMRIVSSTRPAAIDNDDQSDDEWPANSPPHSSSPHPPFSRPDQPPRRGRETVTGPVTAIRRGRPTSNSTNKPAANPAATRLQTQCRHRRFCRNTKIQVMPDFPW